MNEAIRFVLVASVQSALLALCVGGILFAARIRSGAVRHRAWLAVLGGMMLMPLLSRVALKVPVPIALPAVVDSVVNPDAQPVVIVAGARVTAALASPVLPAVRPVSNGVPWSWILLAVYASGVVFLLSRLALGWRAARLIIRGAVPVPYLIGGAEVCESALVNTPLTVGLVSPRIVLPVSWTEWDDTKLQAVLAHEAAHVRNHDVAVNLVAYVNRAIFWFHPLAWWLEKKLAMTAEQACDEAGARAVGDRKEYARVLLDVAAAMAPGGRRFVLAGTGMRGDGGLEDRVDRILRGDAWVGVSRARKVMVSLACVAAILAIPMLRRASVVNAANRTALTGRFGRLPGRAAIRRALALKPNSVARKAQAMLESRRLMGVQRFQLAAERMQQVSAGADREMKFEVLSVRPVQMDSPGIGFNFGPTPNGFSSRLSVWQAIMLAYASADAMNTGATQVNNAPKWIGDFYDFNGKVAAADVKAWQSQGGDHELLRSALKAALRDRFHLAVHEQAAQGKIFELVVAKNGAKLKTAGPHTPGRMDAKLASGGTMVGTQVNGKQVKTTYGATMQDLAWFLTIVSGRVPVRDRTGLAGRYDFTFRQVEILPDDEKVYAYPVDHLGLKVRPGMESRPILVIDHIEKLTAN